MFGRKEDRDLNALGERILELVKEGASDEQIAKKLDLTVYEVCSLRKLVGIKRRQHTDFNNWHKLKFNEPKRNFVIWSLFIPQDKAEVIGLDNKKKYQFMPHCSSGMLKLEIEEKDE